MPVSDNYEFVIRSALAGLESEIKTPELMPGIKSKLGRMRRRRAARFAAAAAVATALLVMTAAAAAGGFARLLELPRRSFAGATQPIEASSEDDGLALELISGARYHGIAVFYIELRDTSGAGRLNHGTLGELSITANGKRQVESLQIANMMYYDRGTDAVCYEVRPVSLSGAFDSGDITFRLERLELPGEYVTGVEPELDIAEALRDDSGRLCDIPGTSWFIESAEYDSGVLTLRFSCPAADSALDSGFAGRVEGTVYDVKPYLLDTENRRRSFSGGTGGIEGGYSRWEYTFAVQEDELPGLRLFLDCSSSEVLFPELELTVSVDDAPEPLTLRSEPGALGGIPVEGLELELTPASLNLSAAISKSGLAALKRLETYLETSDGPIALTARSSMYTDDSGRGSAVYTPERYVPLETVSAIVFGSTRIEL